tara:strand:- start:389 stop:1423 length:1035 start_codon:yes stop_codon:yes gene_type:complete
MRLKENAKHHSPKVICFGEALVDRLGPLSSDPSRELPYQDCLGGAPANVACALARLGIPVAFLGRLGEDQIGMDFRNLMLERHINIDCLQIDNKLPSRVVKVCRNINGERSFGGFAGDKGDGFSDQAIELNSLTKCWPSLSRDAEWLLVGSIPLASRSSCESLWWCLKQAREDGVRIAVDVNWRPIFWDSTFSPDMGPPNSATEVIQPLLAIASLIKVSKEEAIWFFKTDNPLEISSSLVNKPDVVVTDGALPVKWMIGNFSGTINVPHPSSVEDTTGAGDCFTAGLIFQFLKDPKLSFTDCQNIIRFAAACGALVCSGAGAIDPQPTYEQVKSFLLSGEGWKS